MAEENSLVEKLFSNISPEDIETLLEVLEEKINQIEEEQEGEKILTAIKRARLLGLMLQDWWAGEYTLPWRSAAAAGGALIYFLNPRGLIKDKLSRGWILSDAAVISICCHLINEDLQNFVRHSNLDPARFGFQEFIDKPDNLHAGASGDNQPEQ